MKNWTGPATGVVVAILATTCLIVWMEATPFPPKSHAEKTLAATVALECDPDRIRELKGDDALNRAITCRDLHAQDSMALSTKRIVWLSWLQIFVAIIGSGTVIWTVIVGLRSLDFTRKTLDHQQLTARMQLRPTLKPRGATVTAISAARDRIQITFENAGSSTAVNFKHVWSWRIVHRTATTSELDTDHLHFDATGTNLTPGTDCGFGMNLSATSTASLRSGTHVLQVGYWTIFDDALGGRYRYAFSRTFFGNELKFAKSLRAKFENPELKGRET